MESRWVHLLIFGVDAAAFLLREQPAVLVDTAGIQNTDNPVEQEGVDRTFKMLEQADLILCLVDIGADTTEIEPSEVSGYSYVPSPPPRQKQPRRPLVCTPPDYRGGLRGLRRSSRSCRTYISRLHHS